MTREEAIEIIKQDIPCEHDTDLIEALEMAIKAFEREPCEDCISRESVRQLICKNNDRYGYSDRFHEFTEECLQLPPVTPQYTDAEIQKMQELEQAEIQKAYELGKTEQPKIGHWIDDCGGVKCSCCGYCIDDYYYVKTYCPNCGAKMEAEE